MPKEVSTITCTFCESTYKLSYDPEETSGHAKFCPFCCSEPYYDNDDGEEETE